ncbi:ATP-binding protein [Pseudomonas sp. SLFW]|uniref:ATP-binding protein n=1 Tax=Pseudomonas sp. SLFW TaxID=2683259 RepID=UPI001411BD0F|nr:ATP-binding protein [Pseudomonas sp. SLFW]NBB11797.1 ATP-binding protein [Pseudomonas sp. SLFW]
MARTVSNVVSMMGDFGKTISSEKRVCSDHGAYTDFLTGLGKARPAVWSGCQQCAEERRAEADRIEQEKIIRENTRRSIESRVGRSCIPPRFSDRTFANFRVSSAEQKQAANICREYAENFPAHAQRGRSLMLLGNVGTGKTHLATAVGNHIIREFSLAALYVTAGSVIRHVKSSFDRDTAHNEVQAYQLFAAPDLLILDEVGVQNATEFERTVMFELINSRYEAMKPTIVISNRGRDELPTYMGDRVVDRLRENGGKLVLFTWESQRGKEGF